MSPTTAGARALLLGALLGLAVPVTASAATAPEPPRAGGRTWSAAEAAELARRIDAAIARTALAGTHLGLIAVDAERRRVLYARNADEAFVPGSTLKLITGAVALDRLGTTWRFRTQLVMHGAAARLVLLGGGDPQLGEHELDEAAAAVSALGITAVGGLTIDARAFSGPPYDAGWGLDDRAFGYAAPITALAVDENALHVTITPGAGPAAPARVAFASPIAYDALAPTMRFVNDATTVAAGSKTTADAFWDTPGTRLYDGSPPVPTTIGLDGVIALGAWPQETDVAIPEPLAFASRLMTRELRGHGVAVRGAVADEALDASAERVVWTHDSKPLGAMLADMWLPSDNFIAECWLRALAHPSVSKPASAEDGATVEVAALRALGIDADRVMVVDGAGLSRENAISPRAMATVLEHGWAAPWRGLMLDALPVAGVRGTLRHRFAGTPLQGRVFAKTGSLTNVSNIAGYLSTSAHGAVSFVIFADDALIDDPPLVDLQRRILAALSES